jgi:hypothetical protein
VGGSPASMVERRRIELGMVVVRGQGKSAVPATKNGRRGRKAACVTRHGSMASCTGANRAWRIQSACWHKCERGRRREEVG